MNHTIVVRGDLDQPRAADLRARVTAALATGPEQLILELSGVAFVDSSGLGALVSAYNACRAADCRMVLSNVPPRLAERLHITGLEELFQAG